MMSKLSSDECPGVYLVFIYAIKDCHFLFIRSVIPVERATAIPRCLSELNGDYLTEVPDKNGLSRTVSFGNYMDTFIRPKKLFSKQKDFNRIEWNH